ncbi:MAG: hypothetical protein IJZ82_07915 [Lachnospiraceae bacterium]|nr:hypothetical protein [Lachnospiraceae bacterium]
MLENQEMMEKLQKSLKINRYINLFVAALLICLLVGGGMVVYKITPAISAVQEMQISLKTLEQIDFQELNRLLTSLDVEAMNKAIAGLDVDGLNEKIDSLDVESLNEALEGLDTEELTEALENLNNAVDKLEKIGESLAVVGDWFKSKFNF